MSCRLAFRSPYPNRSDLFKAAVRSRDACFSATAFPRPRPATCEDLMVTNQELRDSYLGMRRAARYACLSRDTGPDWLTVWHFRVGLR